MSEVRWPGARFDRRAGEVLTPPANVSVPTYEVLVKERNILVRKHD